MPALAGRQFTRCFHRSNVVFEDGGHPGTGAQRQEKPMNDVVAPVWNGIDFQAEAHRDPSLAPLDEIDVSNPYLYSEDTWRGFFARLRRDDPVHFCDSPLYGRYWSVTRYRDIMSVDTSHQT